MAAVVYYSSESGNTHRLVEKIGLPSLRLGLGTQAGEPFVLVVPSYRGGKSKGVVEGTIVQFLNVEANRKLLRGVIGTGNTNFGRYYCRSAEVVANKCKVPLLQKIEVFGTSEDVEEARKNIINILGDVNAAGSL